MYRFDERRRPLYVFHLSGRITLEDIESFERDTMRVLERRCSHASVMDLAELEFPSQEALTAGAKLSRRVREPLRIYENSTGEPHYFAAYVMGPRMSRAIDFLVRVASRSEVPSAVFASVEEATAAAQDKLWEWESTT